MKKALLTFLIAFFAAFLNAQVTFVKGYLIPDKGDTLKGEVKINPKKEHENSNKVFFKDGTGVQKNYKPNKVKGYGYDKSHYVAIPHDGETKFYKRLSNGNILFYKVAFEITNMNETSFDFDYFLFKEGDKKLTTAKQNKFKKQLQEWMVGNADFASAFEDAKIFNQQSAIDAINKYNDWKKAN